MQNKLYTFTKSRKWTQLSYENASPSFKNIYQFILTELNQCEGKGGAAKVNNRDYHDNHYHVKILSIESHRLCTVAFCEQTNLKTQTKRYVVYGTEYDDWSEYGIGRSLSSFTTDELCEHCPSHIQIKLIKKN